MAETPTSINPLEHLAGAVEIRDHGPTASQAGVARSSVRVSEDDRNAILASLYQERTQLAQAKRLGRASANDEEYLSELEEYIDYWEGMDHEAKREGVWARFERVAEDLLKLQAMVESSKRK